jgi:heme-degrading monooxygenase HmoA
MNTSESVLSTTIYHPKPGSESSFLKKWNSKLAKAAYSMGADDAHIYHNEESDEFLASIHWPSKELATNFLHSREFQECTSILNTYCIIPSTKEHFEILKERAA